MRASLLILLSFVALASACESETGILVNTSASESLSADIHGLRFYVGKNEIDNTLYYADRDPLDDVELEGRDIAEEPYRLLLTPRGNAADGDAFVVAVLALGPDGRPVGLGRLAAPVAFQAGKVLQWDLDIVAVGGDVFVTDTGCLKYLDEGLGGYVHIGVGDDADCDGVTVEEGDCDDLNPAVFPGQREDCDNGVDDNCNGLVDDDDNVDADGDGYASCGVDGERDCNDNDAAVHPGAAEICDGLDNDCNGLCDDGFDLDGDQVTTCGTVLSEGKCVAETEPDCDDKDPARYPGNAEICDGIDNDCSGRCDDDAALDPDGDGYTDCGSIIGECGVADFLIDCEPNNGDVHPGAAELCDGIDNDCDGSDALSSPCFATADQTCREGVRPCTDGMLASDCTVDAVLSTALAPDFCSLYESCEADTAIPDAFACILDAGNQQPVDELCEVLVVGSNTCSGNRVRVLPEGNADGQNLCSYAIIGGQNQQGYNLTLVADGNVGGQVVSGCQADLIVEGLPGAGDSTVNIYFDDGAGTTDVIQLRLKAHHVASCTGPGLSCASWDLVPQ